MTVEIVTFANLGDKENHKTIDVLPVIERFSKSGELQNVICQLHKNFFFPSTRAAIPPFVWYPLRVLEKTEIKFLPRSYWEMLFDYFARYGLVGAEVCFIHGGHFLPRTLQSAQKLGSLAVDLTVMAHPQVNARLVNEELALLGIRKYNDTFSNILKKSPHCNEFDYVIALSDFVKDSYVASHYPEDRIFIAYPDVDIDRFTITEKKDTKFRVVYTAYTTPLKGLHYLLEAWNTLRLPDAELILIGGYGEIPQELQKQYNALIQGDPSILWVGNCATPEDYYRTASAFVFPSLTEGFGRVTLEAMACGIPVVTTENAKGIVEDGKTGFVVPIRDAKAVADKLRYLYDHRDVAVQMGINARAAVENKKPFGEAVYEIYQDIMRREDRV